jgi:integrase
LSTSRITQAHQLVGAVLKYAQRTGKIAKNVAAEIKRDEDLPSPTERERRYLTHAELSKLAKASDRFETLTLILGYCGLRSAVCGLRSAVCGLRSAVCGLRFSEAAALRRKHIGERELTITASATAVAGQGVVESDTKTKRTRHVPVPGPVWDRLKGELPSDPNALVFP